MPLAAPSSVRPAYLWVPPGSLTTSGDEAAQLAESLGFDVDQPERDVLSTLLSESPDGGWATLETAVICARQNIKALACDTPVLTKRGFVTMATIAPGDSVMHPGGHWTRVADVSPVNLGHQCYRVTTTDGRSIVADAGHLWTVTDTRREIRSGDKRSFMVRVVTTQDMVDEGLSRMVTGGRTVVADGKSYRTNEYRFRLPVQEPLKTDDVDLPIDPYLFGAWLGDGTSRDASLTCHEGDVEHWSDVIARCGFIPTARPDGRPTFSGWTVGITCEAGPGRHSRSFASKLRALGVLNNKHVPDMYLTAGTAQREALLQGLMDTDGTISRSQGQASFTSTIRSLSEAVLYLARSLGWRANIREQAVTLNGKDCGSCWQVAFTPKATDPFSPFRMARKSDLVTKRDGGHGRFTVSVKSIEPVESVPVRCIKVDSPDGLFLAGRDLVATHNTWALLMTVLHDLYLRDVKRVTWSSHLFKTTADAFNELDRLIGDTDWMRKRVRRRRASAGQEGFDFVNGATIDFLARSKGAGRGLSGSTVILDEALFLSSATQGALIPTLSAQPNPHVRYGSSPGVLESQALRSIRNRGRAGGDPSLSYIEYTSEREACANPDCAHELAADGCQLDNEEKWAQANPALGRRITLPYVRDERRALSASPVEFMRERLGWWEDPPNEGGVTVFPLDEWIESTDATSEIADGADVSWAVDVSWNRASAYVSAAGRRDDGLLHARVVHYCDPSEVAAWIGQRVGMRPSAAVALQGTGAPVSSLLEEITRAVDGRCPVVAMSSSDTSKACGVVFDAVKSGALRHVGDAALDRSLLLARARPLGDGWALDRKGSPVDIANLVSLVNAAWLAVTHDEPAAAEFFVIF